MNDDPGDRGELDDAPAEVGPFRYHLELTPQQLKITHTALRSLLDDFGHDEPEVLALIHEVLAKLPDEHAIRAIQISAENEAADILIEGGEPEAPPPSAA